MNFKKALLTSAIAGAVAFTGCAGNARDNANAAGQGIANTVNRSVANGRYRYDGNNRYTTRNMTDAARRSRVGDNSINPRFNNTPAVGTRYFPHTSRSADGRITNGVTGVLNRAPSQTDGTVNRVSGGSKRSGSVNRSYNTGGTASSAGRSITDSSRAQTQPQTTIINNYYGESGRVTRSTGSTADTHNKAAVTKSKSASKSASKSTINKAAAHKTAGSKTTAPKAAASKAAGTARSASGKAAVNRVSSNTPAAVRSANRAINNTPTTAYNANRAVNNAPSTVYNANRTVNNAPSTVYNANRTITPGTSVRRSAMLNPIVVTNPSRRTAAVPNDLRTANRTRTNRAARAVNDTRLRGTTPGLGATAIDNRYNINNPSARGIGNTTDQTYYSGMYGTTGGYSAPGLGTNMGRTVTSVR